MNCPKNAGAPLSKLASSLRQGTSFRNILHNRSKNNEGCYCVADKIFASQNAKSKARLLFKKGQMIPLGKY